MLVDGLSYLGNLGAECNHDKRTKKVPLSHTFLCVFLAAHHDSVIQSQCVELVVSGISLSLLLGFTVAFAHEAASETFGPGALPLANTSVAKTLHTTGASVVAKNDSDETGTEDDVDPKIGSMLSF